MSEGKDCTRIDIVFDVYKVISIKNAERSKRGESDASVFKEILPGHNIKQWGRFLKGSKNKESLIRFFGSEWKKLEYRKKLTNKCLYMAYDQECWKLTEEMVEDVPELHCAHEEADTRIIFHAEHASRNGISEVLLVCEDTDVMVLALAFSNQINASIYQKRGTQNRTRIIDISQIKCALSVPTSVAIPGLHAFTGCDSVSSFSGKGKLSVFKLMKKDEEYRKAFEQIGQTLDIPEETQETLERFVCQLYGSKTNNISDLRYLMFCAKGGEISSHQLPPSHKSLYKHILRANYQAFIWRCSLTKMENIPHPQGYGWKLNNDNELQIDWNEENAAPDAVLELISCSCKNTCSQEKCSCASNSMECTDMCKCKKCTNMPVGNKEDVLDPDCDLDEEYEYDDTESSEDER